MRPVRLHVQGFTAFHNPVTVDFAGRKLFAITGPTGAGKSSLLDAMIWALFGRVPRVGNQVGSLISHGANLARVQLEFEARGQRYLVARVRQTRGATAARLERLHAGGESEPLADSVKEVDAQVEALLGIDYETFVKTIILPQGEFSAFLSGDPKEKKGVLSKLLGLEVYKTMMQAANNRSSGARIAAEALQQQYEQIEYRAPETLAALEGRLREQEERASQVAAKREQLRWLEAVAGEYVSRAQTADADARSAAEAEARAQEAARAAEAAREALARATDACGSLGGELATLDYDSGAHDLARRQLETMEQLDAARTRLADAERATEEARVAEAQAVAEAERQRRMAAEAEAGLFAALNALTAVAGPAASAASAIEAEASAAGRTRAEAERKGQEHELRARQLQHLAGLAVSLRRELEAADAQVQRTTAAAAMAEAARIQAAAAETAAVAKLEAAQQHLESAQMQDAAAGILATLRVGDRCPVCGEPITALQPHAAPELESAERSLSAARKTHAEARIAHLQASNDAAAAHAKAEAARASFAGIEVRQATLDDELAAASVSRANVDRAAKRASSAAAAERDRALDAQRRAEAQAQAAQRLRVLLAKLPPELDAAAPAPVLDGCAVESLAATLCAALEDHARAQARAAAAAAAAAEVDTRAASAAAEVKTALALQKQQAAAVETAQHALVTLSAPDDSSLPALRSRLAMLDALAARASELSAKLARAEQERAGATAVLTERTASCEAAARAVIEAEAVAAIATAAAEESRAAFEAEWRRQLGPSNAPDVTAVPELLEAAATRASQLAAEVGAARATLAAARAQVEQAAKLQQDAAGYRNRSEVAGALGLELQANRFVAFIQHEAMQVLAADAGERMLYLSRDRYRLEADGDEFVVVDRLNGDERRPVRTLSGGETFLASLALALALSERLPELSGRGGALSLESLFLDEGFGSLDAESLDVAIQGLELLASDSRMIGVISHIPELAERLSDRIDVVKTGGMSTVRDGR